MIWAGSVSESGTDPAQNRLPGAPVAALAAVPAVFLAVFYVWPFATVLARGLTRTAVAATLARSVTWDIAWFTLWQAVVSTVLTIAVGLGPAYVLARYRFAGRRLLASLLTAGFVLPTVVMGAAILALLPARWERGVPAILVAHVVFNLAVVVRTVGAVWEHLPGDLEAAAATLGASPWRAFREVTLPLLRPAILAAASIVFVFTFTSFGVIRVLGDAGTSTIEVEIWRQATQLGNLGTAATLAVLQLVAVGLGVAWTTWQQRRHSRALALRPLARRSRPRPGRQRLLVAVVATATGLVVVAPLGALVARSLRGTDGYTLGAWRTLGRAEVRPGISVGIDPVASIAASLRITAVATVVAVVIGLLAALAITGGAARRPAARHRADAADRHVRGDDRVRPPDHVRHPARRLARRVVARAGRPGARRRAVRRAHRAAGPPRHRSPPPRGGGDTRRLPEPDVVGGHRAAPAPPGDRCGRARRGDLPR